MTNKTAPNHQISNAAKETTVEHVLTLDCPDSQGIVHAVSGFLFEQGCDVLDIKQYGDRAEGHFFMRVQVSSSAPGCRTETLRRAFAPLASTWGMNWQIEPAGRRRKVLIMVSGHGHCLNDLLFRARTDELPIEIAAVVSNHRDHEALVQWHGIPFFHIPVTPGTKAVAEADLLQIIDGLGVELVILARYMQVLSQELSARLAGRIINIHHSFLPSFKGAKPYHQPMNAE